MIEFLSSWVKNISLSIVIVSILEMLLPNNKLKKYLKMIMGMYILFNIISPFIENSNIFNIESIDLEDLEVSQVYSNNVDQTSMDKRLKELYIQELEKDIEEKLKLKGYIVEKCKVDADILENKKDSKIRKIAIKIDKKENTQEETIESKLVTEIEKINKVKIGKEKSAEKEKKNITKSDEDLVKKFLIEEYGVNEKCLEIN